MELEELAAGLDSMYTLNDRIKGFSISTLTGHESAVPRNQRHGLAPPHPPMPQVHARQALPAH